MAYVKSLEGGLARGERYISVTYQKRQKFANKMRVKEKTRETGNWAECGRVGLKTTPWSEGAIENISSHTSGCKPDTGLHIRTVLLSTSDSIRIKV